MKSNLSSEDARLLTEKSDLFEILSLHVVNLTAGEIYNLVFLLDTELGIMLWYECPSEMWFSPSPEPVYDDHWDYTNDDPVQAPWRGESTA